MAMIGGSERTADRAIWLALLTFLVALALAVRSLAPPEPLPIDAPSDKFSGLRALETLRYLLGDETPHPVGSAANQAVRDRLIETLRGLGVEPQVQRTIGCSGKFPLCARVENVLAEIPGTTTDAVALMAHYDSVPHAPGAADDGSGVATLLESARALLLEPRRRNRILLVFTDAEEMGLLGAEGFFASHPWVPHIKAVVNVEGGGSGGPSLLLRSSNPGGHLLNAFRETAQSPIAISYAQEVFARMPNDTDFTVPDRAGIPGIDFAFAFEFNHYHTPLDSLANLDRRSLQHHGDNVLPLTRRLADMDLNQSDPNFSYLTIEQSLWLTWPVSWTTGLAIVALAGLGGMMIALRSQISIGTLLGGMALATVGLLAGLAGCFAALWLGSRLAGTTVGFPADPWPWRLLMFAGGLLPLCLLGLWAQRRLSFWPTFLGVWLLLGCMALALAIAAPLAANLLIIPVLAAAIAGVIGVWLSNPQSAGVQTTVGLIGSGVLGYLLLGVAYAMEETQGLRLAPAIYVNVVLVLLSLLVFRVNGRLAGGVAATLALGWIWISLTPLYSEWRPQHLSYYYVLDRDQNTAHWSAITANPVPAAVSTAFGTDAVESPVVPWLTSRIYPSFAAPAVDITTPEVGVERANDKVTVRFRSRSGGDFVHLVLPADAGIHDLEIAGISVEAQESDGVVQSRFFAAGSEEILFEFRVAHPDSYEGYIIDGGHQLPPIAAPYERARGSLAVPQHQGDQRIAFQRIQF